MQNLLKTRWQERNIGFGERLLQVTHQFNARGTLHSTGMVQAMYKVACEELAGSRQTIVMTVIDSLVAETVKFSRDDLMKFATQSLEERMRSIDGLFRERARVSGMLESGMLKGHINLDSKMEGAQNELKIELIRALEEFQSRKEGNLKDRILHKLLNIPVVAWLVIAMVVVAALVSLISDIVGLVKGN